MKIRPAQLGDENPIFEMICELAEFEKLRHEVSGSAALLRQALFAKEPKVFALVVDTGAELAGFALYFYNYSTFLTRPGIYLEDLYVRPKHRSGGLGLRLLQALAEVAQDQNCARLDWSVLTWNQRAIDFYKSLGAVPLTEWTPFRLREDEINALVDRKRSEEHPHD